MDKPFSTPIVKKTRSLGLRRSCHKAKIPTTPASDVKVNYKSLESPAPATPSADTLAQPGTSKSTCKSYRLSLSRRFREQYKKKKLEFNDAPKSEDNLKPEEQLEEHTETDEVVVEESESESELEAIKKHDEKVEQLQSMIAQWSTAFKDSFEELSEEIRPKIEPEQLLAQLQIPQEMMKYL